MITTLHIKNIGIIEDLTIDLNKGLNVLTGETGAGKTLIIDSLQIISGGRFSKDMIRRGENNSFVELCMYDPKNEKSEDGNIIVSREINLNGKNMCKINGRMVSVNELRTFMKEFIEIHGQNDNQNLLDNKLHLQYLDGFIGEKIENNLNKYYILYEKYNKIKNVNNIYILWYITIVIVPIANPKNINVGIVKFSLLITLKIPLITKQLNIKAIIFTTKTVYFVNCPLKNILDICTNV